ncbi:MAG: TetR/AcrR family transcriptional regulator [Proteobacteria bacterium]|nr:MAG: TetR/AcrR family transcriptional regulator [Pseudomonadota bacterium]
MGLKERREREKKELREKILDSARSIFADKGYHSVTIRDIARITEYSVPTLYSYFKDKESIVIELVKNDLVEIQRMSMENALKVENPEDQLREYGLASLRYMLTHPEQFKFLFQTFISNIFDAEAGECGESLRKSGDDFLRSRLNSMAKREMTQEEFMVYRIIFIADIHGILSIVFGKLEDCPNVDIEKIYLTKWNMFSAYLKAKEGAL